MSVRFYKIVPIEEARNLLLGDPTIVHWLKVGTDRWTGAHLYPGACGENILGEVVLSTVAGDVTCETCAVELVAQALRDEAKQEGLEELGTALNKGWR